MTAIHWLGKQATPQEKLRCINLKSWSPWETVTISTTEKQVRIDLASAYQLAAMKGWDDGIYTHISACVPGEADAYLINQFGLRFDEVTPENLVKVNLQGGILSGSGPVNQSGFAIHGAVHMARPDAFCVMHLHIDAMIAVSSQQQGLLPISQHALRFYEDIAAGLLQGKIVVDMSSISPIATKAFAQKINALGCDYLDAPVSGGELGAKNATLSIMVGGDEKVFEKVKPVFELMGKNINLVGGNGDGQTAKVANQIIVALNIEAVAEALLFAAKAGADPAKVRQALMGGFASSKILEVHGERMVKRTFDPGFRIELHQKDLNLALNSARALGVSLPNTATAQELFNSCSAHGGKAWDHSAMVKALEKLANFEIGQKA